MNTNSPTSEQSIVLVTGANKGIGFQIARGLGQAGQFVLVGARSRIRGEKAAASLREEGLSVRFLPLDVTDSESVADAAREVDSTYGRLDTLINNAGIAKGSESGKTSEIPVSVMREVYETNVFAVVEVSNTFIPLLLRAKAPQIINLSSEIGSLETALQPESPLWPLQPGAYGSSKTALNMLTVSYAKEFWDSTLKVNAVTPGYCATDLNGHTGWRTAEQGAQAAIAMATKENSLNGTFTNDGTIDYLADTTVPW